jgi:hypothetical protein
MNEIFTTNLKLYYQIHMRPLRGRFGVGLCFSTNMRPLQGRASLNFIYFLTLNKDVLSVVNQFDF